MSSSTRDVLVHFASVGTWLLHHDGHVHVAVIRAAEVVADGGEGTSSLGINDNIFRLPWLDHFVDLQCTHKEAVGHVFTVQPERNFFALLERDSVGGESEAFRCNIDYPIRFIGLDGGCVGHCQQYNKSYC